MANPNIKGRYQRRKWSARQRLDHYSASGANGCTLFTGAKDKDGYGKMRINGRDVRAHRVAWEIAYGPIPDGTLICHRCETPACISLGHLFAGSHLDSVADRKSKGRVPRGARHGRSRLSDKMALEIYRAKGTRQALADRYGVGRTTVGHIKRKETWRHIHAASR
jgi:hypothetical protein